MEKKSWKPSLTGQYKHCPVPHKLDTYLGCEMACTYCFGRDIMQFTRRNSEHKEFNYLVGLRTDLLEKWLERIDKKDEYNYRNAEEVAFKERIPLKIGSISDPFPRCEENERITYETLRIYNKYDYPIEIQTKNPGLLLKYAKDFIGANWTIAVTLISADDKFSKIIEPNAPSPTERLKAIKGLTDLGFNVMIKIQPAIYPKILEDLPILIKKASEVGVWDFNIEGLKCKISMGKVEQKTFQLIGDCLGMNIREFYREERKKECNRGSDYELSNEKKIEMFELAKALADKYNMKFFNADNYMNKKYGASCECCGTEKLRNYKLLSCDMRSKVYGNNKGSLEFEKCSVRTVRDRTGRRKNKTIKELCDEYYKEHNREEG